MIFTIFTQCLPESSGKTIHRHIIRVGFEPCMSPCQFQKRCLATKPPNRSGPNFIKPSIIINLLSTDKSAQQKLVTSQNSIKCTLLQLVPHSCFAYSTEICFPVFLLISFMKLGTGDKGLVPTLRNSSSLPYIKHSFTFVRIFFFYGIYTKSRLTYFW